MPSWLGRMNATWPLGILTLAGGRLTVRVRGFRWLAGRLEGCTPDEIDLAFPVKRGLSSGVGVRRGDGKEFYFWTRRGDEVIYALRRAGFSTSDEIRRAGVITGRSKR